MPFAAELLHLMDPQRYLLQTMEVSSQTVNLSATVKRLGSSTGRLPLTGPVVMGNVKDLNSTLQMMLKKLSKGNPRMWDKHLDEALYAHNHVRQNKAGLTPYQINYGQKSRTPGEDYTPQNAGDRAQAASRARRLMIKHQSKEKLRNAVSQELEISPGQPILLKRLSTSKGQTQWQPGFTLLSSFHGGARILGPNGEELRVNSQRIKADTSVETEETPQHIRRGEEEKNTPPRTLGKKVSRMHQTPSSRGETQGGRSSTSQKRTYTPQSKGKRNTLDTSSFQQNIQPRRRYNLRNRSKVSTLRGGPTTEVLPPTDGACLSFEKGDIVLPPTFFECRKCRPDDWNQWLTIVSNVTSFPSVSRSSQ